MLRVLGRRCDTRRARTRIVAVLAWVCVAGCSSSPSSDRPGAPAGRDDRATLTRDAETLFRPADTTTSGSRGAGPVAGTWSVLLGVFRGPEGMAAAETARRQFAPAIGARDLRVEPQGEGVVFLLKGRYASGDDPGAREALRRARAYESPEGGRPFAFAMLLAPETAEGQRGSNPRHDLLNARRDFPGAQYTLQIAAYGREDLGRNVTESDLAEPRRAAEQAAAQLRREGELAFYYHGRTKSSVTIGVFSDADYDQGMQQFVSAELTRLRARYPHNLYNGKGIQQRDPDSGKMARQPSMLVRIPGG